MSALLKNYARFDLTPSRGEGVRLWDIDDREYLDFGMGIAVCSIGHCHPRQVAAIHQQAHHLIHCSNLYQIPMQEELGHAIVDEVVRIPGKVMFSNSGAESNEALIKLARKFGQATPSSETGEARYEILTFDGSFHGRTFGSMTATGQEKIHGGFGPLPPGFRYLPFNDPAALQAAIRPETCAILVEPVQGEGGINPATAEFLEAAAAVCKEHDLLLMLDEVQCGFGRAGAINGWEAIAPDLQPDAISWAKGMGGGFPIGAVWINDRATAAADDQPQSLPELLPPGTHGSTYAGAPLASAAALAVVREILDQDLAANAAKEGAYIHEQVAAWQSPWIKELRGPGLMLGFELDAEKLAALPAVVDSGGLPSIFLVKKLMENGLITVPAGPGVVRWLPPLNVERRHVDLALKIMRETLESL